MRLVKTCLCCGLVNRPTKVVCINCGADLPINAFHQPHLDVGTVVDLGRADPETWAASIGGGEVVVTPDRRAAVVRRRWTEHPPRWNRPVRLLRVLLEMLDQAGKVVAQMIGLRGWPVEAVFDRGQPRRLTWLIRGRKASREAVRNISDALRIGDLDYRRDDRR